MSCQPSVRAWLRALNRALPAALLAACFAAAPALAQTPAGTIVVNTATARWSVGATPFEARAEQRFSVQPYGIGPDLALAKAGPAQVAPGSPIVWRLVVSNNGSHSAANVRLQDAVPPQVGELTASCAAVTTGVCGGTAFGPTVASGTPFSAVIASLPPGGRIEVTLRGKVAANATSFTNRAQVSVPGFIDPTPADNSAAVATSVVAGAAPLAATLRGNVWVDTTHDRVRDASEPRLPDISVRLYDAGGTVLQRQAVTGNDGAYAFNDLPSGISYQLEFRDASGRVIYGRPVTADGSGASFAATAPCADGGTCYTLTQQGSTAQVQPNGRTVIALQSGEAMVEQSLPLDPSGVIYDAASRAPLAGATVTLVGPNGFDAASQLLGGIANASQVTDATGRYQFLLLAGFQPGVYRLDVTAPAGYLSPSTTLPPAPLLDPTELGASGGIYAVQSQADAPAAGSATTYHLAFDLAAGDPQVINNHVPLDPLVAPSNLTLTKTVNRNIAAVGDLLQYRLQLGNTGTVALAQVQISDTLPHGLRYRAGSLRIFNAGVATALVEPTVGGDGRSLTIAAGTLAAGASAEVRYVVEVGAGTRGGPNFNVAQARAAGGATSLQARARIDVQEDLFASRIVLAGRVIEVESCTDADAKPVAHAEVVRGRGIPGALVTLQDGTRVRTDTEGKWHVDGLRAGTHVVQLDVDSLPPGYEALLCAPSSRRAGRSFSQFVNAQGGTLWRADFHVKKTGIVPTAVAEQAAADEPKEGSNALYAAGSERFDAHWLASAAPGFQIVFPPADFNPGIRATKVIVQHNPEQRIELLMNGQPVHMLNRDGGDSNAAGTVAVARWGGVALREGVNRLTAVAYDHLGNELARTERELRFAPGVVQAQFVAAESVLKADGRTVPVIALRMLDADGKPARPGIDGGVRIGAPYKALAVQQRKDARPLLDDPGNEPHWRVGADGIARVRLDPTTASGEVELTFNFPGREPQRLRVWLEPELRDWILVGFAEGTIGHRKLSGHVASLSDKERDDHWHRDGQIAFYAKGKVRADWLLTLAYDSDKERKNRGGNGGDRLGQNIERKDYYTVYGDSTSQQHDAASLRKLYVKIERKQFYALFGDFDTGLSVTELARYSRFLNGVKSEYRGEQFSYNAFAARTAQTFVKDELRGDGTSGFYRLSRQNLIANSERVSLQIRDRLALEKVVASEPLARGIDYDIDYSLGTIVFRRAIPSRGPGFDPALIVVDYEVEESAGDQRSTAGGRVAMTLAEGKVEIGASAIHEGGNTGGGSGGQLVGADLGVQIDATTRFKAEIATSRSAGLVQSGAGAGTGTAPARGEAYLLELRRQGKDLAAGAYLRGQDSGFGLGQQSKVTRGTTKVGADLSVKIDENMRFDAQAHDERIDGDLGKADRVLLEGRVRYTDSDSLYGLYVGARALREHNTRNETLQAGQILAGAHRRVFGGTLNLRADAELSAAGSNASTDYPNRLRAGADYKITEQLAVFGEQEVTNGADENTATTRIGVRSGLWQGAEVASSVNLGLGRHGPEVWNSVALTQNLRINEKLSFSAGIDRSATVRGSGRPDDIANSSRPAVQGLDSLRPVSALRPAEDYFALFGGMAYHDGPWGLTVRADLRNGDSTDRHNLALTVHRDLAVGEALAASLLASRTSQPGGAAGATSLALSRLDLRLNYAWRAAGSPWMLLERFDFIDERQGLAVGKQRGRRFVNNLNANWQPSWRTQLALQYGAKYVLESFDGAALHGYTDLIGAELRHDIGAHFDIGVRAAQLHSWRLGTRTPSYGISAGTWPMDNLWLGLGYNFAGFRDADFNAAGNTSKGWYVFFRFKFDQGERDPAVRRPTMFDETRK